LSKQVLTGKGSWYGTNTWFKYIQIVGIMRRMFGNNGEDVHSVIW